MRSRPGFSNTFFEKQSAVCLWNGINCQKGERAGLTADQTWPLPAEVMLHFQHTAHGFWGDALNPRCAYRFDSSARNRINPWSG